MLQGFWGFFWGFFFCCAHLQRQGRAYTGDPFRQDVAVFSFPLSLVCSMDKFLVSVLQRHSNKLLKALQHSEMHFKLRSHHGLWQWGGQQCTQGFSLGSKLESVCLASMGVQGSAWACQRISSACITHSSATVFLGTSCT